jgi:hypothetical protein
VVRSICVARRAGIILAIAGVKADSQTDEMTALSGQTFEHYEPRFLPVTRALKAGGAYRCTGGPEYQRRPSLSERDSVEGADTGKSRFFSVDVGIVRKERRARALAPTSGSHLASRFRFTIRASTAARPSAGVSTGTATSYRQDQGPGGRLLHLTHKKAWLAALASAQQPRLSP